MTFSVEFTESRAGSGVCANGGPGMHKQDGAGTGGAEDHCRVGGQAGAAAGREKLSPM